MLPEVGTQAQQALRSAGIDASVTARSFGEVDSCETYKQLATDFTLVLGAWPSVTTLPDRESVGQAIRRILGTIAHPSLGNVNLTYPDGEHIVLHSDVVMPPLLPSPSIPAGIEIVTKKVYVVVYDPLLSNGRLLSQELNWLSHAALTQGTVDFFQQASHGEMNYQVVETTVLTDGWPELIDGYRYTEQEFLAAIRGQGPWHSPGNVSYNKIVNDSRLDICGKANRGEIDEVWIYNGPGFGFYESTLVGPGAYLV